MSGPPPNGSVSKTTVSQLFSKKPDLLEYLYSTHPQVKPDHVVFDPCVIGFQCIPKVSSKTRDKYRYKCDVDEIISPASSSNVTCDVVDQRFGVLSAFQNTSSASASQKNVVYLQNIHIIGVLTSSAKGFLRFHALQSYNLSTCKPNSCRKENHLLPILIAPAPPPQFYHASVYISDWRFLPGDKHSPPMLEVLLHHIHLLDERSRANNMVDCMSLKTVFLSENFVDRKRVRPFTISGVVSAKSPVLSSRSPNPSFLVELVSANEYKTAGVDVPGHISVAVTVVFQGEGISWWPFISVSHGICVSNVRPCALRGVHKGTSIRVTPNSLIYTHSIEQQQEQQLLLEEKSLQEVREQPQPLHGQPFNSAVQVTVPHIRPRQRQPKRKRLRSGSFVSYEGTVTRHFPPAAIELDNMIVLHLGEFNFCIAGDLPHRAFRVGARIAVSHLIMVIRPATPVRLFSTARTSTNVLYFGEMSSLRPPPPRNELWLRVCKRLSPTRIMAAEELFDAFVRKFRRWFAATTLSQTQTQTHTQTQSQSQPPTITQNQKKSLPRFDDAVEEALIGNAEKAGLVQYVMRLLGEDEDILRSHTLAIRNVSKEFLNPICKLSSHQSSSPETSHHIFNGPVVPTFANVRDVLSLLCADNFARRQQHTRHFIGNDSTARNRQAVFDDDDISRKIIATARIPHSGGSTGIALVGLIQGIPDGRGLLQFSDGSDALDLRCVPSMPPYLIGAMVCVRRFTAVVDVRMAKEYSSNDANNELIDDDGQNQLLLNQTNDNDNDSSTMYVTLVCDESDFKVVIDGPCVNMDRDNTLSSIPELTRDRTRHSSHAPLQHTLAILTHGSQMHQSSQRRTMYSQTLNQDGEPDDEEIVDVPLVCIFVQRVQRSPSTCVLIGRFMAMKASRNEAEWTVVDCEDRKGFWECEFRMLGESMLTMSSCFTEGRLYVVSCTDLEGVRDPLTFLSEKALRAQKTKNRRIRLHCELETTLPWVENLGLGVYYMRFEARSTKNGSCEADNSINDIMDGASLSGSCISEEGEQFNYTNQAVQQFQKETVDTVQNRVWKLYEWHTDRERSVTKVMCVRGIVNAIETVTVENGIGVDSSSLNATTSRHCIVDRVTVVDEIFGLFDVVICFSNGFESIRGIAKGMKVTIRNLLRVPFHSQYDQAFKFVANHETSVCIHSRISEDNDLLRNGGAVDEFCECHNPILIPFQRLCDELGIAFIEEFMGRGDRAVGLIHINTLQVEYIRARLGTGRTVCDECGIPQEVEDYLENDIGGPQGFDNSIEGNAGENGHRIILMDVAVQVGDGSRIGIVRCSGFDMCMRLICATKKERDALLRLVASGQDIQIELANGAGAFVNRHSNEARRDADTIWGLFQKKRSTLAVLAVINKAAINERSSGCFEQLGCKSYSFGFRRSVLMGRPRLEDRVLVECVAIFQQAHSLSDIPSHQVYENDGKEKDSKTRALQRRNVVSCLTLVKNMLPKDA